MQLRKRYTGDDINKDQAIAIEATDVSPALLIGYAKNEVEANEYIKRHNDHTSHEDFFHRRNKPLAHNSASIAGVVADQIAEEKPHESRQHMRRVEALHQMFDRMIVERVKPAESGPNFLYVTFEEFEGMFREYQDALKSNDHKNFAFQPLSAYHAKLQPLGRRAVRPIFSNECGVYTRRDGTAKICILKDRGPGDAGDKYFQVPDTITSDVTE